ncbi:MAG: hypothetical protein LLG01_00525 [Planctomycetaceae bacterium]|nr:hypothetical protein [Planctomycetaceae bacterium]
MRHICLLTAVCVFSGAALADGKSDFDLLFAQEARKVEAANNAQAFVAFAGKIMDAAKEMRDAPASQAFFYEQAMEYGSRSPTGYPCALNAIQALVALQPDQKAKWSQKTLSIAQRWFQAARGQDRQDAARPYVDALIEQAEIQLRAGNAGAAADLYNKAIEPGTLAVYRVAEIRSGAGAAAALIQTAEAREKLTARLAENPKDVPTREAMIYLYLIQLDNPAKAKELLAEGVNKPLESGLQLACKDVQALGDRDALTLGEWYLNEIMPKASGEGKIKMLVRAKACFTRFKAIHPARDALGYKAQQSIDKLETLIEKVPAPIAGTPQPTALELRGTELWHKFVSDYSKAYMGGDVGPKRAEAVKKLVQEFTAKVNNRRMCLTGTVKWVSYRAIGAYAMQINLDAGGDTANPNFAGGYYADGRPIELLLTMAAATADKISRGDAVTLRGLCAASVREGNNQPTTPVGQPLVFMIAVGSDGKGTIEHLVVSLKECKVHVAGAVAAILTLPSRRGS